MMNEANMAKLREVFGEALQQDAVMANYTTARVGGSVPALIAINTLDELVLAAQTLWSMEAPFTLLGSGSNILVSDHGLDKVILLNRANKLEIDSESESPSVTAESGAILGTVARLTARKGLSGMEW
ncbi:MAG: FAD-binding protein, partial [Anaerolineaceae bacterium]|nr:FAD-binding protein [Anaerolineaceae bacterium]